MSVIDEASVEPTDDQSRPAAQRQFGALVRKYRVDIAFFGVAFLLRCFATTVYRPTVAQWIDGPRFARIQPSDGVFSDFWAPAGYPAFLAVLRVLWDNLTFTIFAQHLVGLATAGVLAATARRSGVPRPWHLVGGALVAFGGDYLFLEHLLMAETLFLFWLSVGTYFGVRAIAEGSPVWAAAASGSFAAAALVRSNGLVALVVLPLALITIGAWHWRRRALLAAASLVPGVVAVVAYLTVATAVGPYAGLSDMSGWHLYSRVAPFADCTAIDAVEQRPELASLCLPQPAEARPGPYFFEWSPASPARQLWGLDPEQDATLRSFAVEVILNQPFDYLGAVGEDLVRTFAPEFRSQDGHGQRLEYYSFDHRDLALEEALERTYDLEYSGTDVTTGKGAGLLAAYQGATRLPGVALAAGIVLAVAGAILGRRGARRQTAFVLVVGLCVLLGPILLFTWDFRYVLPAAAILVLAGVIGVSNLRSPAGQGELGRLGQADRYGEPSLPAGSP
ncbi:MAG: hypothetical protein ACRDZ2_11520 [Ilumatobacteraceae bacterium]